jgi:hypothetical protein
LLAYLGATAHGLLAGTDSSLLAVMGLYAGTFLVVVFLTVYWIVMGLLNQRGINRPQPAQPLPAARQTASRF